MDNEVAPGIAGSAGTEPDPFPPKIQEISPSHRSLVRHGTVRLEDVLPFIAVGAPPKSKEHKRDFLGFTVKLCSLRLQCFAVRGVVCAKCGVAGTFFALEQPHGAGSPHLNLYGLNANGVEVLMTFDHILCKAAGGPNIIENAQTLCAPCNVAKGASVTSVHFDKFKKQMSAGGKTVLPKVAVANFERGSLGALGKALSKISPKIDLIDPFAC